MSDPRHVSQSTDKEWMRKALHDLAQPVTALECGLFVGSMIHDGEELPKAEDMLSTIRMALVQCERVSKQLRTIQDRVCS